VPELTQEQQNALDGLIKFRKQVQTLGGYAGTGKSTVISHLIEHNKCKDFQVCTPTGKAADVLR
jgi:guanylate kinase